MQVTYIGPFDAVEIAATGQTVANGETVDVPDEIAGKPPKGTPDTKGYDPGAGMLAQSDAWTAKPSKERA